MPPRTLIAEDNDQAAAFIEAALKRQGLETERAGRGCI